MDRLTVLAVRPVYRLISWTGWKNDNDKLPSDISVSDIDIPLEGRSLKAQLFEPQDKDTARNNALLVYFHGGGMCCGGADTTHYKCMQVYASKLKCTVIGVNYRLAPECPCPGGVNDCIDSAKWVKENMASSFASNGKMVVGGDSAGGLTSIATSCAIPEHLSGTILFYPNTCYDDGTFESWRVHAKGHALTANMVNMFLRNHLGMPAKDFEEKSDSELVSKAFPLRTPESIVKGMAPSFLVTCEHDILQDEQLAMKKKMEQAEVKVEHHHYSAEHGFMCTEGRNANFEDCLGKLSEWYEKL